MSKEFEQHVSEALGRIEQKLDSHVEQQKVINKDVEDRLRHHDKWHWGQLVVTAASHGLEHVTGFVKMVATFFH